MAVNQHQAGLATRLSVGIGRNVVLPPVTNAKLRECPHAQTWLLLFLFLFSTCAVEFVDDLCLVSIFIFVCVVIFDLGVWSCFCLCVWEQQ